MIFRIFYLLSLWLQICKLVFIMTESFFPQKIFLNPLQIILLEQKFHQDARVKTVLNAHNLRCTQFSKLTFPELCHVISVWTYLLKQYQKSLNRRSVKTYPYEISTNFFNKLTRLSNNCLTTKYFLISTNCM